MLCDTKIFGNQIWTKIKIFGLAFPNRIQQKHPSKQYKLLLAQTEQSGRDKTFSFLKCKHNYHLKKPWITKERVIEIVIWIFF